MRILRFGAWAAVFALTLSATAAPIAAEESGPQGVVRSFCRADGMGNRLRPAAWPKLANLVEWQLEPAWDHVLLIAGYEIGGTRAGAEGSIEVDVRYNVVGTLSAVEFDPNTRVETVTFRVHAPDAGRWRIIGPPPPPHVFGNQTRTGDLRRLLEQGRGSFMPNSLFVWRMLRSAGWDVPYRRTFEVSDGSAFAVVTDSAPGDLVAYLNAGRPYHVGLLESEAIVVSATMNAGIVRAPVSAFPGEARYLRLLEPRESEGQNGTRRDAP